MSDLLTHECGIALLRLKKPLQYYINKYGTAFYALNKMYLAEVISKQTYISEAKRRNILSEEVTFDDEQDFMMQEPMDEPDNVAADNGDNG